MEINKVVYNGDTLLDLTSDTVTPQTLLSGATAHAANGQIISGTVELNGKSVSWTGTGTATNSITFPEKPTLVLSIQITNKDPLNAACMPFRYGSPSMFCVYSNTQAPSVWKGTYTSRLTYSADELTMTITGTDKGAAWNDETTEYILYYI